MRTQFSYTQLQTKAVTTGFSQRTSKLSAAVFFDNLFHSVSLMEWSSLSYMVFRLQSEYGIKIRKQSLDERFNESSAISDLSVTSGNRNDRTDATESSSKVEKGDLIIRDQQGAFSYKNDPA